MNEQTFKNRIKKLALAIINLAETLPETRAADFIARQIIRPGTSSAPTIAPPARRNPHLFKEARLS